MVWKNTAPGLMVYDAVSLKLVILSISYTSIVSAIQYKILPSHAKHAINVKNEAQEE